MNGLSVVHVLDGEADLDEPFEDERLRKEPAILSLDATVEIAAVGILHDDVEHLATELRRGGQRAERMRAQ